MAPIDNSEIEAARAGWHYRGAHRPPFAISPKPGQESVWDYPRPPVCVPDRRHIQIYLGDRLVADSGAAVRVLETAGAPTFYLPPGDIDAGCLRPARGASFCEWKGAARYWHVVNANQTVADAAWAYPDAGGRFAAIAGYLAFYCAALDCRVDGERARPQPGGFYGGWVTDEIVGPFKGEPGTSGW